ncbi:protoheme IX farnesyltransferase [Stappia sp. GBMRC 2046]|uniref:Protoheme IX farnesyltransferase n=1 Tax=Stappia sediminis TaxID=2692190 RepID=A0A7X3LW24_9HYPH|nr:protoheme IX farnesyltransferase [Stappia sediminis]
MSLADAQGQMIDETAWSGGHGGVSDYFALLKPRVMSLVIFTALVGIVLAPGGIHPVLAATALLCIAIGAGASGALNMWYDADIDSVMSRTRNRPIPAGRVTGSEALAFGLTLSGFSVFVLGLLVNWFAAALLAFTIFFYVVIYTMWLKRSTPQNIVIGGAAGAFPPVVGWAAVTGSVSLESLVLFLIIFMWTPPHFWALALFKSGDYQAANVPMMPVVAGENSTRNQIFVYSLALAPVGVLPWLMGFAGFAYGAVSVALGVAFIIFAYRVWTTREGDAARRASIRLFSFSILYLFLLFAVLLGEHLVTAFVSGLA